MRMILEIGHRKVLMCTFGKVITSNYTRLLRYVQKPMPKTYMFLIQRIINLI